jgi:predicted MFS family arabinose efflux permease
MAMFFIDPLGTPVWVVVCFVGLGEIGMIISNLSLVTSQATVSPKIRGSVAGVSSACGAIGILVSSKLGGALFDSWNEGAPFLLMALGHIVALFLAAYCIYVERFRNKKEEGDGSAEGNRSWTRVEGEEEGGQRQQQQQQSGYITSA